MKNMLFALLLLLTACGGDQSEAFVAQDIDVPEDFLQFYQIFHTDTAYQAAHISFPLAGLPNGQPFAQNHRWTRADWQYHRPFDLEATNMVRHFRRLDETTIEEVILQPQERSGILRRFSKLGDQWFLIYYAGMNRIAE